MSGDQAVSTWRVDSQTQRQRVNANNALEDGYDIFFTTGEGHNGSVFVPASKYTPAQVKAAIDQAAAQMDAIGALTHDAQV